MTLSRKLAVGIVTTAASVMTLGGTAFAGHAHFIVLENPATGEVTCQYVGQGQTSISDPTHGGYHQFHENVHTGQPGMDGRGTTFDKEVNEGLYDCDIVRHP